MEPIRVGIRDLKNNLSRYLREVKSGQSITITERGKPIGQIVLKNKTRMNACKNCSRQGWLPGTVNG